MIGYDRMKTECAGDHVEGASRLAQEESRKNMFYGAFHPNKESVQENHGDRNRAGSRDGAKTKRYE